MSFWCFSLTDCSGAALAQFVILAGQTVSREFLIKCPYFLSSGIFLHLKWIFNSEFVSSRWPRKISLSLPVAWGSHLGITFSKSLQLSFVTWAKIRTFTIPVQVIFAFKMSNFLYYSVQKHSFLQEKGEQQRTCSRVHSNSSAPFFWGGRRAMHQHFWQFKCLAQ